ncbi:MAG TPA: hypothetical protein VFU88_20350 [Ktedonobacterales bacterium]|nr:hypothetical protein [Ktedonobacterales bacterium]
MATIPHGKKNQCAARALVGAPRGLGRDKECEMADVLFALVTVAAFALLIAFVYACDRL